MSKRPSLLETLKQDQVKSAAQDNPTEITQLPVTKPQKEVVKSTVYFPKAVHQTLREIAFTQNCKVHDLVLQGLSHVLKEHGYPSVEELKKE